MLSPYKEKGERKECSVCSLIRKREKKGVEHKPAKSFKEKRGGEGVECKLVMASDVISVTNLARPRASARLDPGLVD